MKHSKIVIAVISLVLIASLPVVAQQRGLKAAGKASAQLSEAVYRQGWALVIGINKYPQLPPQYQLRYSEADAEGIASLLQREFGFEKTSITALKGERATKQGILDALASFTNPNRVQKDDCVLIYFSGHGQTVSLPESRGGGKMGFLVP